MTYALALAAQDRCDEADEVLGHLIDEQGSEPSTAELLGLRAYVAERHGDAQQAVQFLLETASEEPLWLALAAERAHTLLEAPNAETARSWLAGSGGARFRALRRLAPEAHLLTIRAAVLSYDGASADSSLAALGRDGPASRGAARTLLEDLAGADLDARQHLLVGQLLWDLGDATGALNEVERALARDLPEESGRLGQAGAFRLRGDAWHAAGAEDEAAEAYLEAGKHYSWSGDPQRSVRMLDKSVACRESADAEIYLAESLRTLAADLPEEEGRQHYKRALDAWRRGTATLDGTPATWVLESGVMIIDGLAAIERNHGRELYWTAVLVEEQGLTVDDQSATLWTYLSRHHRCLDNFSASFQAADRALAVKPGDPFAAVQRTLAETETMRSTLTENVMALPAALDDETRIILRALTQISSGHQAKVAETLFPLTAELPSGSLGDTVRYIQATALEHTGQHEAADVHWRVLWGGRDKVDGAPTNDGVAAAGFWLGEYAETEQLLRDRLDLVPLGEERPAEIAGWLALVLLAQGRRDEAREYVECAITTACSPFQMEEQAAYFVELARRLTAVDQASAALAATWGGAFGESGQVLRDRPFDLGQAIDELRLAEKHASNFGASEQTVRAAVQAGLARLLAEADRDDESLEVLVKLAASPTWLTWLSGKLGQTAVKVGQSLLRSGRHDEAVARIVSVLASSSEQLPTVARAELNAILGFARLLGTGPITAAAEAITAARADLSGEADSDGQLARWWQGCLADRQALWRIASRPGADGAAAISGPLWRCHSLLLGLGDEPTLRISTPLPIVLEISEDLVPDDTSPNGQFIGTDLPTMRERIEAETGVWIPGVRVRVGTDLQPRAFRMWIFESNFASGNLRAGSVFCPRPAGEVGVPSAEPARHPVTATSGCWLPAELVDQEGHDYGAWTDPLTYVLASLERHVRNHLARFVTPDWLAQKTADREGYAVTPVRIRLGLLLRDLAAQQVPLNDMDTLLAVASPAALMATSSPLLADRCRAALRPLLPGNRDSDIRVALSADISHNLHSAAEEGGLPPVVAMAALHAMARAAQSGHALVTSGSTARRALQWLGSNQFPGVAVLSADEALPPVGEEEAQ